MFCMHVSGVAQRPLLDVSVGDRLCRVHVLTLCMHCTADYDNDMG